MEISNFKREGGDDGDRGFGMRRNAFQLSGLRTGLATPPRVGSGPRPPPVPTLGWRTESLQDS